LFTLNSMNPIIKLHQEYCDYCITFKGYSSLSIKREFYILTPFVKHLKLESLDDMKELTRIDVERYILERKFEKNWAARTIKNNLQALFNFFKFCEDRGHIELNPVKGIEKPKAPKDLPKAMDKEDALKLLEWLYIAPFRFEFERIRAKAIVAMFLFTGVRRSELLNLNISDIRIQEGVVHVERGKGAKDRLIPMNERLIRILKEYISERVRIKKTSTHFFVALRGDKSMGDGTIRRLFSRFKQELKMNVHPHKLRHTFATLMIQGSCNLPALAKMMGHTDIKTTMGYLLVCNKDLKEQIGKHPLGFTSDLPHRNYPSKPF